MAKIEHEARWLAAGAFGLSAFSALGISVILALIEFEPSPVLFVFPFLFGFIACGGAGLGLFLLKKRRGWMVVMALVLSLYTLLGACPAAVLRSLSAYRALQLQGRQQQAVALLTRLRMGVISDRHERRRKVFFEADSGWVPPKLPTARRYPYTPSDWEAEPWKSFDFKPSASHFHQFRYRSFDEGQRVILQARGDLDGDGQLTTYTATVWLRADGQIDVEGPHIP